MFPSYFLIINLVLYFFKKIFANVLSGADIPIINLPYLTFPTTDQRKPGLLSPNLGRSSKRGLEISLPYYWNLAPNIDLTTTPTLMAKRGRQLTTE